MHSSGDRGKPRQGMRTEPRQHLMIEEKGLYIGQGGTAGRRPAHTVMLLTLRNEQIIGFFNHVAGVAQAEVMPEGVAGDMAAVFLKIGT